MVGAIVDKGNLPSSEVYSLKLSMPEFIGAREFAL
jgi:hypothetical protein